MGKARRLKKIIKKWIKEPGPIYDFVSDKCYEKKMKWERAFLDARMKEIEFLKNTWKPNDLS